MNNVIVGMPVISDILYDRVIDVELYRTSKVTDVVSIFDITSSVSSGLSIPTTLSHRVAIYRGDSHITVKGTTVGDRTTYVKREVNAVGGTVHINTNELPPKEVWYASRAAQEAIKAGIIKSGNVGCRIQLNSNGKIERYHAAYLASDDSITSTYAVVDKTTIACTKGSHKPSIAFSTNVIPGNSCYKMVLKIINLNLDFDIREITRVKINAGYREQGIMASFECPVFSSYIESPNPDGVTVFECLSVGQTDAFTSNTPIRFHYHGGTITIGDFVTEIAKGLGDNLKVNNFLKKEYRDIVIGMQQWETYAENAAITITWARKIIQKCIARKDGYMTESGTLAEEADKNYPYVMMYVSTDGALYVYCLNRVNQDEEGLDVNVSSNIPVLDAIKGATFNGVALTVKSVWNPRIKPGSVFQMNPNVYNGANLPNSLDATMFGRDPKYQYFYRCITCSIAFSTNGNENEMSILAVPLKYMEDDASKEYEDLMTFNDFISQAQDMYSKVSGSRDVDFGQPAEDEEILPTKTAYDTELDDMFGVSLDGVFGTGYGFKIVNGNTLSGIAQRWFAKEGDPNNVARCPFPLVPMNGVVLPQGIPEKEFTDRAFLWPIIAVLTYQYWYKKNKAAASSNPYECMDNLRNPDKITVGKYLVIPIIPNIQTLARCKDIFKFAYSAYNATFPTYASWCSQWKALYYYLGGTGDV